MHYNKGEAGPVKAEGHSSIWICSLSEGGLATGLGGIKRET